MRRLFERIIDESRRIERVTMEREEAESARDKETAPTKERAPADDR
jgi:hypothetical protein